MTKFLTRRDFLKTVGIGGIGTAAALALAACGGSTSDTGSNTSSGNDNAPVATGGSNSTTSQEIVDIKEVATGISEEAVGEGDYSEIRIAQARIQTSFNPYSNGGGTKSGCRQLMLGLADGDGNGDLVGVCAKEATWSDDRKTIYVEIWDNIYDSEGNHITADDVIYTWDMAKQEGMQRSNKFEGWAKTGDYTVEFYLKQAPDKTGMPLDIYVFSQKAYEASADKFATDPVSIGPYVMDSYTADYMVSIVKNDHFWATEEQKQILKERIGNYLDTNWDKITFRQIGEASQVAVALQMGEVDFATGVSAEDLVNFKEGGLYSENYKVISYVANLTQYLLFNTDELSPLHDARVRQAICWAVDSEAIVATVYRGEAAITHEIGNPSLKDYNPAWNEEDNYYSRRDLDKAKSLLAEAGYPDGLKLTFLGSNSEVGKKLAEVLQAELKEAGIEIEILALDNSTVKEMKANDHGSWDFEAAQTGAGDYMFNAWAHGCLAQGNYKWPGTAGYYYDEKLAELMATCSSYDGYGPEAYEALHEYHIPLALGYGICNTYDSIVIRRDLNPVLTSNGQDYLFNAFYYGKD